MLHELLISSGEIVHSGSFDDLYWFDEQIARRACRCANDRGMIFYGYFICSDVWNVEFPVKFPDY
jgi:hypothetical protein